jgi:hypothetical protein
MQTQAMMEPLPDVTVTGTVPHGGYHHDELTGSGSDARAGGHEKGHSGCSRTACQCHWQWQGRTAVRCSGWCICS